VSRQGDDAADDDLPIHALTPNVADLRK